MAYATLAQLKQNYGEDRLAAASPRSSTSSADDYWTGKLDAGSAVVDSYLCRAGHSTPVNVSAVAVAHQAGAAAFLAEACIAFALQLGGPAIIATPKGVVSSAERIHRILENIVRGSQSLPWLAKSEPAFGSLDSAAIDSLDGGVPALSGWHFTLNRMPD